MNKKFVRMSAILVFVTTCALAQEQDSTKVNQLKEVVISDTKFAQSNQKSGKVIVKISAEDLAKKSGQSVATILSSVVGMEVNGNQSSAGKNLGYYIRGARNRQTLILIDGVPVTDASSINLEYDLRLIPVEQVESIEIMKGASSTLYGSGAAAGVINVTLKKATRKTVSGNAYMSLGTQTVAKQTNYSPHDFNQGFSFGNKTEKFNYFASLNSTETKGISEAKGTNFEDDRFSRVNSLVKIGFTPSKKLTLDFSVNYDRLANHFDNSFDNFNNPDTPINNSKSEQFRLGFSPKYKYEKGEFVLNSSFNTIERNYEMYNSYSSTIDGSNYKSRSANIDAFNKYILSSQLYLVVGTQFQFNEMGSKSTYETIEKNKAKFNTVDPYFTAVYNSSFDLNINIGGRYNVHSVYGNHLVYNINPSFHFAEIPLKIISSYSTAYITPSLYQLYSPYGNLDLTPEANSTLEVGLETELINKKLIFNIVAFNREEKNSIGFYTNPTTYDSNYTNIDGKHNAKGLETMLSYAVFDVLKINANYTFTQVEEKLNRLIPKHKANISVDYQVSKKTFLNLNYQYVDNRNDAYYDSGTFKTQNVILHSYQLVNALAKYDLIKNRMTVFGSVNNIFDADFTESIGYSTRGRNFKIGLNINL